MDSYVFMNSVRKVKRKQYDNRAVIAFFPPTVFGRAESHIQRQATGKAASRSVRAVNGGYTLTLYLRPVNPQRGSSGGYAKSIGFMGNGIAIVSPSIVNYMFN